MKKVIIIGSPGSGKSTFAKKLRDITNLPLYHLDMLYHNEDGTITLFNNNNNAGIHVLQSRAYIM